MDAGELSYCGPEPVRDAATAPVVQPLRRKPELRDDGGGADRIDEGAVFVTERLHAEGLHGAFNNVNALSLSAPALLRFYTVRVIEQIGKRIRARIGELGLDQTTVAESAGVSVQRLNNYIQGRRMPDLPTLVRLASALQTTTDWILGAQETRVDAAQAILSELLAAAGVPAERAGVIVDAVPEAMRLLSVLPDEGSAGLRSRMAARAAWHSRSVATPS